MNSARQRRICDAVGVFRDFVTLVASELDLVRIHTPESRARCRQITARYKTAEYRPDWCASFSFMVNALSEARQDFLGEVYMETRAGSGLRWDMFSRRMMFHLC